MALKSYQKERVPPSVDPHLCVVIVSLSSIEIADSREISLLESQNCKHFSLLIHNPKCNVSMHTDQL